MSIFPTAESLPANARAALNSSLKTNESFLGGIQCRSLLSLGGRRNTCLLLTDQRILEYQPGLFGGNVIECGRQQIGTASVSMGLFFHQLILAGPNFRRSFRVYPDAGRAFADAIENDEKPRIDAAHWFHSRTNDRDIDLEIDEETRDLATPDHWENWHYAVIIASIIALIGAATSSLVLLGPGYLLIPVTLFLDIRYVEASDARWQPDIGLYMVGGIIFPLIIVPMYLYRRHEVIGL